MLYLTKEELYRRIDECRKELYSKGVTEPLTIEKICSVSPDIDISYIPFKTAGLRGMVQLATPDEPLNCILVNSNISETERNFHAMHEFMHIYLHSNTDCQTFKCYDKVRENQNSSLEWQANESSAEILMPYRKFVPLFSALYDIYQDKELWDILYEEFDSIEEYLAQKYYVSSMAAENRISGLSYEIDQYRDGIPVEQITLMSYSKRNELGINSTDYVKIIKQLNCQYSFELDWDAVIS